MKSIDKSVQLENFPGGRLILGAILHTLQVRFHVQASSLNIMDSLEGNGCGLGIFYFLNFRLRLSGGVW